VADSLKLSVEKTKGTGKHYLSFLGEGFHGCWYGGEGLNTARWRLMVILPALYQPSSILDSSHPTIVSVPISYMIRFAFTQLSHRSPVAYFVHMYHSFGSLAGPPVVGMKSGDFVKEEMQTYEMWGRSMLVLSTTGATRADFFQ
jgi:hypothetical protein